MFTDLVLIKHRLYSQYDDVEEDRQVQQWCQELSSLLNGFPSSIRSRDDLVNVLTMIIWTASGQHSAVNYPQYRFQSFMPNG
jgi:hypothetical protein